MTEGRERRGTRLVVVGVFAIQREQDTMLFVFHMGRISREGAVEQGNHPIAIVGGEKKRTKVGLHVVDGGDHREV